MIDFLEDNFSMEWMGAWFGDDFLAAYINSWQIYGDIMETVTDFIFWGSKITADSDYSHEIKRHLLLGRKVMISLDIILKNRHYFANKVPSSQSYGFSSSHVWM